MCDVVCGHQNHCFTTHNVQSNRTRSVPLLPLLVPCNVQSPTVMVVGGGVVNNSLLRYASLLGASAISLGAFGAHALSRTLDKKPNGRLLWNTAVLYHLIHSVAMLGLHVLHVQEQELLQRSSLSKIAADGKGAGKYQLAGNIMMAGVCMFSGSLYALALDMGPKAILGPTTPVGGLLMIGSWLVVGFK